MTAAAPKPGAALALRRDRGGAATVPAVMFRSLSSATRGARENACRKLADAVTVIVVGGSAAIETP